MYVADPPVRVTVPLAGAVLAVTESVSPSASVSLAKRFTVTALGEVVLALSAVATGAVLGLGATATVTVPVAVPPFPSLNV